MVQVMKRFIYLILLFLLSIWNYAGCEGYTPPIERLHNRDKVKTTPEMANERQEYNLKNSEGYSVIIGNTHDWEGNYIFPPPKSG